MDESTATINELVTHLSHLLNTNIFNLNVICFHLIELRQNILRHIRLCKSDHPVELVISLHRHHTWKDGHIDARFLAFLLEGEKELRIEEHLRDDEISSCVNFGLQILNLPC